MKFGNKTLIILISTLFFILSIYLFLSSDERQIKKLFLQEIRAFESEDLERLMSGISYNYQDEYGFNYLYLKEFFKNFFLNYDNLLVEYEGLKIKVSNNRAEAELKVRIIGSMGENRGYIVGDLKNPIHFIFTLEKERFKWYIIKTEITNLFTIY